MSKEAAELQPRITFTYTENDVEELEAHIRTAEAAVESFRHFALTLRQAPDKIVRISHDDVENLATEVGDVVKSARVFAKWPVTLTVKSAMRDWTSPSKKKLSRVA